MPICKNDSLLCSKISDLVSNGSEFCSLLGLPVSELRLPTMSPELDCFNGKSSVGTKYDRLEIDPEVAHTLKKR